MVWARPLSGIALIIGGGAVYHVRSFQGETWPNTWSDWVSSGREAISVTSPRSHTETYASIPHTHINIVCICITTQQTTRSDSKISKQLPEDSSSPQHTSVIATQTSLQQKRTQISHPVVPMTEVSNGLNGTSSRKTDAYTRNTPQGAFVAFTLPELEPGDIGDSREEEKQDIRLSINDTLMSHSRIQRLRYAGKEKEERTDRELSLRRQAGWGETKRSDTLHKGMMEASAAEDATPLSLINTTVPTDEVYLHAGTPTGLLLQRFAQPQQPRTASCPPFSVLAWSWSPAHVQLDTSWIGRSRWRDWVPDQGDHSDQNDQLCGGTSQMSSGNRSW